ncbi:MAG: 6-phosphogluconolactonase, partial [Myxococcota bacterium]|nr:6-phosphogluconolactonase [Myxococcota bacterium]
MTSTNSKPGARLHRFADATATVEELASRVIRAIAHDIATKGDATLVVSGGSTPVALFGRLSQADLDWSRVTITLADERWVPAD